MAIGTIMPPTPASSGRVTLRRSRSSPMSNSRRASSPTTRKKNVISPELTQPCRSCDTPAPPKRTDSCVPQSAVYDAESMFAQARAATAAASSTAALPVSVRRNCRSGVSRFRAQAVRSEKGEAGVAGSAIHRFSLAGRRGRLLAEMRLEVAQDVQVMAGPQDEERSPELGLLAAHDRITHALQELPAAIGISGLRPGDRRPVDDGVAGRAIPGAQRRDLPVNAHAAPGGPGPPGAPVAGPGPVQRRGPAGLPHLVQCGHRSPGAQYPSGARDDPRRTFRVHRSE